MKRADVVAIFWGFVLAFVAHMVLWALGWKSPPDHIL
jgi:hypothetical protein